MPIEIDDLRDQLLIDGKPRKITKQQRRALGLLISHPQGISPQKAAEELGITDNSVSTAFKQLRKILADTNYSQSIPPAKKQTQDKYAPRMYRWSNQEPLRYRKKSWEEKD